MKRSGFTLIELAVVMAVIVTLTSLVVSGFLGIARAMASQTAPRQIRKALEQARQQTLLEGRSIFFCTLDDNSYVLVRPVGQVSGLESGRVFYDYYAPLMKESGLTNRLYNLDKLKPGKKAYMNEIDDYIYSSRRVGWKISWSGDDLGLVVADRYGTAVSSEQFLPKGWTFTTSPGYIEFRPTQEPRFGEGLSGKFIFFKEELSGTVMSLTVDADGRVK